MTDELDGEQRERHAKGMLCESVDGGITCRHCGRSLVAAVFWGDIRNGLAARLCSSPRTIALDAGTATPINAGVRLTLGDRVVDVTGQTNEEIAETAARMINGAVLP